MPDPPPAGKPDADIAEAVIHTAVVADMRPPIANIESVDPADEAPISRRPQQAHLRRLHPSSRYPVVPASAPAPISGRPQVAFFGARRLLIVGQWRRRFLRRHLSIACRLGIGLRRRGRRGGRDIKGRGGGGGAAAAPVPRRPPPTLPADMPRIGPLRHPPNLNSMSI